LARDDERDLPATPSWREVFQGRRGRLTAGLLLFEALIAVEALVVATIMPDVRRDLGMVQLYGLAFSAFALTTFATIPIGGHAADRYGPRRVLPLALVVLALGLLIAALAPSMPVLIVGQLVQGAAAGALYSVSLGTVAKTYPQRIRPRVLALLASMWILPGLVGPPIGALIASTVGWRWAFVAPLPVLIAAGALMTPALQDIPTPESPAGDIPVAAPLQLMFGAGLLLVGLTVVRPVGIAMIVVGFVVGFPALLRIVPRGTLRAAPGLPAAAASAFLLSCGFFAVDSFITLMLTGVREMTLAKASIIITLVTVGWSLGSFLQSSRAERVAASRLVRIGAALVTIGMVGVATGLDRAIPPVLPFVGWGIAGLGMGTAFPTIPLSVMREAGGGREAGELSSTLLMDTLGLSIGGGLGGACIAFAHAFDLSLATGIGGAYAVGIISMLTLLLVAGRLPRGHRAAGTNVPQ
jgi:MFS family permease